MLEAGFLKAIQTCLDDHERLIFADWLEDHAQPDRAQLIRLQCELDTLPLRCGRRAQIEAQVGNLTEKNHELWVGTPLPSFDVTFHKGLLGVTIRGAHRIARGAGLRWWRDHAPWIERVELNERKSLAAAIHRGQLDHLSDLTLRVQTDPTPSSYPAVAELEGLRGLTLITSHAVDADTLGFLLDMPQLHHLHLKTTYDGGGGGLPHKYQCKELRSLTFRARGSAKQFQQIGKLQNLRDMTLSLTRAGCNLTPLCNAANLRRIYFHHGEDPAGRIADLADAPALRQFLISHILLSEETIQAVSKLTQLEHLRLCPTSRVGVGWMAHLRDLKELRSLNFSESGFIQQGNFTHLVGLPHLEELNLDGSPISAKGLAAITRIPGLKRLYCRDLDLTGKDMQPLRTSPLEALSLAGSSIDQAGCKILARMPSLTWLDLERTTLTKKDIDQLQSALPQTHIIWAPRTTDE